MSTCEVQASGAIELLFYGELREPDRAEVERHVRHCEDCRRAFDDLVTIRTALASRPDVASPPGGEWAGFMARLDETVRREATARLLHAESAGPSAFRHGRRARRVYGYLAVAAVLMLVTIVVLLIAGRRGPVAEPNEASVVQPTPAGVLADAAEPGDDTALRSVGEDHFERSKLVVLGLATKDPGDGLASNWAYEQELASALLDDTRLYRLAAEERGMNTLAGVMRDLELLLLEASMSEQPNAESLESLQRLIRRRDLLTKMEVVKTAGL